MNDKCSFLFKNNMGYSEKAFGNFLPYDIKQNVISIRQDDYAIFFLDCNENYQNYLNKVVELTVQVRKEDDHFIAGRLVMTCCMADIQFLGFKIKSNDVSENIYYHMQARIGITKNQYGLTRACYIPINLSVISQSNNLIINVNK